MTTQSPTLHTPGPWKFHRGRGANPRFHVQTSAGYQIASTTELNSHPAAALENAAREANARLIAAAPDLAEALAVLLGCCETDCMDDKSNVYRSAMIDARAALAKAGD